MEMSYNESTANISDIGYANSTGESTPKETTLSSMTTEINTGADSPRSITVKSPEISTFINKLMSTMSDDNPMPNLNSTPSLDGSTGTTTTQGSPFKQADNTVIWRLNSNALSPGFRHTGSGQNVSNLDDASTSYKGADCSSVIVMVSVTAASILVLVILTAVICAVRVMVSAAAASVVVLVILTVVICVVRMKRKWRRKLREERLKTDIWTMSTYNNTIINENFADYTLATTPMPERKKDGTKWKKNSKNSSRSSGHSRELIDSWYSDGSGTASLRRNTFSEPNSIGKRKIRTPRQVSAYSAYSGDCRFDDGQYERGRTSTFSVGWNAKMRDKNALVNHEEPVDKSSDDFRTLNFYSAPQQEDIFTEL